jgi:ethanolamine utilization protein EutQ (cupin superfamily)
MTVDESVDYGSARVIPLTNTTNNKGYNYTSHNCVDYTDLQSLNASIGLDAGEGVGVWNRATFTWTMWISELGITNSQVNRWDVVITKVQDSETYTTCW